MVHGNCIRASVEHAAERAAIGRGLARASGLWGGYQAWRELEPEKRLQLVDRALRPANDRIDEFPLAL